MDSYRIPREKANRWIDEVVNSAVNEFVSHRGWIMEDAHDNSRSHLHGTLVKQIRIVIAAMLKFLIHSNNLFGRYLSAIDIIVVLDKGNAVSPFCRVIASATDNALQNYGQWWQTKFHKQSFRRHIQKYMNPVLQEFFSRTGNDWIWIRLKDQSEWRIKSRSRSPRLPFEIFQLVIDFLSSSDSSTEVDDFGNTDIEIRETLLSCRLTCRSFFRYCHKHLYKTIKLEGYKTMKFNSFFDSLSRWTYLQGLTTEMEFNAYDAKKCHQLFLHSQKLLPNLQSIALSSMPPLHPTLISIRRPFHSVTSLSITKLKLLSLLDPRRLIDSFFPNITHLNLSSFTIKSPYVLLPRKWPHKSVSVSSLEVRNVRKDTMTIIGRWLSSTETRLTIRTLGVCDVHLQEMIPRFGHCLEKLEVCYRYLRKNGRSLSFKTSLLPSLRTLSIILTKPNINCLLSMLSKSINTNDDDGVTTLDISSQLSCIRIWISEDLGLVSSADSDSEQVQELETEQLQEDFVKLDAILLKFGSRIRIEVEEKYWGHFQKLGQREVLSSPTSPRPDGILRE